MILFLFRLECLALPHLLYLKLLLLLLVFLVLPCIARIWRGNVLRGRKIPCMDCRGPALARSLGGRASGFGVGTSSFGGRTSSFGVRTSSFVVRARSLRTWPCAVVCGSGWGSMNRSTFSGGYGSSVFKRSRSGRGGDGRPAVIGGGP